MEDPYHGIPDFYVCFVIHRFYLQLLSARNSNRAN
jgi:hypothetical protein